MSYPGRRLLSLCALLALVLGPTAAEARHHKANPNGTFDDGKLDPAYFGGPHDFREADDIDYLWVKEGFTIDGHTFHFVDWPAPTYIGDAHPDGDDRRLAREMNDALPTTLQETLGEVWDGRAKTSLEKGDVRVEGRIVDCSTGNDTAKWLVGWGAGAGSTTFDIKFVDAKSGELLVAIHHRVVSGTEYSTTSSKLAHWIDTFADEVRTDGFAALYQKAKAVDD